MKFPKIKIFGPKFFIFFFPFSIFPFIDYNYTSNLIVIRSPLLPLLEENQSFIRSSISMKNIWSLQYERFLIDGEEYEFKIILNKKITNQLIAGIQLPYKMITGGNFDNLIENFHRFTNVTQQNRNKFPKNKINITYEPYGKVYEFFNESDLIRDIRRIYPRIYPRVPYDPPKFHNLILEYLPDGSYFYFGSLLLPLEYIPKKLDQFSSLDNPNIYFQYGFYESSKIKFFYGVRIKIPIYNKTNFFHSYGTDSSIFFSNKYLFSPRWELLTGISYTLFDLRKYEFLQLSQHQWATRVQINYFRQNFRLFFEYLILTGSIENLDRLGEDSHFFSIGYEISKEKYKISLAIIENVYLYATSPDIGIHLSITFL